MISKGRESFHPGKWTYVCSNAVTEGESTARYSNFSFFNETRWIAGNTKESGLSCFKLHRKWPKGCAISSCWFLGNDTKKWFLNNWEQDNNTQGLHKHSKFRKNFTVHWIRLNKQVLVYGSLVTTNKLRSIFVGHIHLKKLMKFRKFIEIIHCFMTRLRNKKYGFF